ncbi:hypothetical protein KSP40_PGU003337 [Platanthera guangdongensis]|uniref:Secreted protein n=1 Tax=Platanthera guangdongensis TaxID=2320717 RepID=A0ABR2M9C0_9ASPA
MVVHLLYFHPPPHTFFLAMLLPALLRRMALLRRHSFSAYIDREKDHSRYKSRASPPHLLRFLDKEALLKSSSSTVATIPKLPSGACAVRLREIPARRLQL